MARFKNSDWNISESTSQPGSPTTMDGAILAVLMDVRDELQRLNSLLGCSNFTGLPKDIRAIATRARRQDKQEREAAK